MYITYHNEKLWAYLNNIDNISHAPALFFVLGSNDEILKHLNNILDTSRLPGNRKNLLICDLVEFNKVFIKY